MPADVPPAPELADEGTEERQKPKEPEAGRPPRETEKEENGGQEGQEPEENEEDRGEAVPAQGRGRLPVGHVADLPAPDPGGVDRRPEPRLGDEPDVVVSNVGQGVPVGPVRPLELFERAGHVAEYGRAGGRVSLELADIAPVELDETAPRDALGDQLEVGRALRQDGQEGHAGPEVDGDEAALGVSVRLQALEGVRLALHRPPFVLAGQLLGAQVAHHVDEVLHERPLGPVLGRAEALFRPPRLPVEPGEKAVVDLVAPEPSVHPLAQLAAAAEDRVDEGRQNVDHGPLRAQPFPRGPADEFLPQRSGPGRVRVDLGRERGLEADAVKEVADEAAEAGDGYEDL